MVKRQGSLNPKSNTIEKGCQLAAFFSLWFIVYRLSFRRSNILDNYATVSFRIETHLNFVSKDRSKER